MNNKAIIQAMKQRVYEANLALPKLGLVKLTWGNVSEINRSLGIIVIKPSGVKYQEMTKEQMVVTDLNGQLLETNALKPSSDLPTHLYLYQKMPEIGAIAHTHSLNSVTWAQAGRALPPYGTTHADAFMALYLAQERSMKVKLKKTMKKRLAKSLLKHFMNKN